MIYGRGADFRVRSPVLAVGVMASAGVVGGPDGGTLSLLIIDAVRLHSASQPPPPPSKGGAVRIRMRAGPEVGSDSVGKLIWIIVWCGTLSRRTLTHTHTRTRTHIRHKTTLKTNF